MQKIIDEVFAPIDKIWDEIISVQITTTDINYYTSNKKFAKEFMANALIKVLEELPIDMVNQENPLEPIRLVRYDDIRHTIEMIRKKVKDV